MRIPDLLVLRGQFNSAVTSRRGRARIETASSQAGSDLAALSELGRAAMEGAGEDRVEQLRLDVSAGNYHPDSAEVAKKIVEYHTGAEF